MRNCGWSACRTSQEKPCRAVRRAGKRVALARAIALVPRVILYDEPTTGLDPIRSDVINELILKLQRDLKVTSVMVTHDMHSAFKIADRIVMLSEGNLVLRRHPRANPRQPGSHRPSICYRRSQREGTRWTRRDAVGLMPASAQASLLFRGVPAGPPSPRWFGVADSVKVSYSSSSMYCGGLLPSRLVIFGYLPAGTDDSMALTLIWCHQSSPKSNQ